MVPDTSSLMSSSVCPSAKLTSFWLKKIWLYINYAIQNSVKEHASLLQTLSIPFRINLLLFPLSLFSEDKCNNSDSVDPVLKIQTIYYNKEQAVQVYIDSNKARKRSIGIYIML